MQTLQTTSLRVADNQLFILDQQALPQEKRWLDASTVEALVGHIHALRVRGAPLIGLSASLLLALLAESGYRRDELAIALENAARCAPDGGQSDEQSRSYEAGAEARRLCSGAGGGSAASDR
ncbi:Methylthioribose-1-phosphate isomerase [Citrobacter koseri]|uniref:Methylthioribose-1-phosphate isomerase n=1 Tax=Citrobacter koseri TaxID=545 RepID=A0A3S4M6E0_CITKO|nr:Methylthioribose-1-phosphate isomerase [Citrobacter koseri]